MTEQLDRQAIVITNLYILYNIQIRMYKKIGVSNPLINVHETW